jgi:hypothetical protein
MSVLEILQKELIGKNIIAHCWEFKMNKKSPTDYRYSLQKNDNHLSIDKRCSYLKEIEMPIIDVNGDSDSYEGDTIFFTVKTPYHSNWDIEITIKDNLNIK